MPVPILAFFLQHELTVVVAVWVGLFVLVPLCARLVVGLRRRRAEGARSNDPQADDREER